MAKPKKQIGVQQMLLHPDKETKAILQYLCEQSGKLYNTGIYFARQTFFKTEKLLTSKFDLVYEPSVGKGTIAQSLPSTPAQQTLMSVAEAFKSYSCLRDLWFKGKLPNKPKPPNYLKDSKLFKVAYPNSGGQKPKLVDGQLQFSRGLTVCRCLGVDRLRLPQPSSVNIREAREWRSRPRIGSGYIQGSHEGAVLQLRLAMEDLEKDARGALA